MKWLTSCFLSVVLLTGCGTYPQTVETPTQQPAIVTEDAKNFITATVTRVVDGDTIEVTVDGKKETVRLILVDTPETKKPNTPVQPFGPEATTFTKEQLDGKEVKLERDVSERDRYGRMLAYVYIGEKMYNELLLEKGLARVAVFPPDVKYVDRFREIQRAAQEAELGIWSIEDYVTDKGYYEKAAEDNPKGAAATTPKPDPAKQTEEVYYPNCAAVKAARKAPLHKGDPGYRSGLDRDGDGIACE